MTGRIQSAIERAETAFDEDESVDQPAAIVVKWFPDPNMTPVEASAVERGELRSEIIVVLDAERLAREDPETFAQWLRSGQAKESDWVLLKLLPARLRPSRTDPPLKTYLSQRQGEEI